MALQPLPPVYASHEWSNDAVRLLNMEVCGVHAELEAVRSLTRKNKTRLVARSVMSMIRNTPSAADDKIYLVVCTCHAATHFVRVHTSGDPVDGRVYTASGFPRHKVPPNEDKAKTLAEVLKRRVDFIIIVGVAYDHVRGICPELVTPRLAQFPRFMQGISMSVCGALPWVEEAEPCITVIADITLDTGLVWKPHPEP